MPTSRPTAVHQAHADTRPPPPPPVRTVDEPGRSACAVHRVPQYEPVPDVAPAPRLRAVPAPVGGRNGDGPTQAPPRRADPVDPAALVAAQHVLRAALEVIDRRRPAAQLVHVLSPAVHQRVVASLGPPRHGTPPPPAQLRSVHVQQTTPTAVEVFGRFEQGPRTRLITGRLDRVGGRWRATALRLG